ncbi:hypothetical protein GH714_038826 [Hevea brasiliensis]|uniref:PCI domain-containing protein n=1 Tax=Hevea brasiliensis TaxID=3981 RepID=A0A6A6KAX1_HEVBR|nr:hypothetical protein GH714_038826 [Hevea brasiliensis]
MQCFYSGVSKLESAWAMEALYVVAYEIRVLAERADKELASNGKSPEKLKGAGSFLMKVFGVLAVCLFIPHIMASLFTVEKVQNVWERNTRLANCSKSTSRSGVYLVLEKLELHDYQGLLKKKSYIIQKQKGPSKARQIKLAIIIKTLKWLEMDMDLDEVECIVAILIYKNLVKGYFVHKNKVVVLSKQDPFPNLNGKPC